MSKTYLLLWLEGPFQSWGDDSRFGRRESLKFPTKSALCGMVCASMGARGEQKELLCELSQTKVSVLTFTKKNIEHSLLRDFQTVGNGYDNKDPFESLLIPKTSAGKGPNGPGSKITHRYYLQDATYAVIWELDTELCQKIAQSLINPVYFVSLGRKNCVPSEWIYQGTFNTENEAFSAAKSIAQNKQRQCSKMIIEGRFPEQGEILVLHDIAKRFGEFKEYSDRFVTIIDNDNEDQSITD